VDDQLGQNDDVGRLLERVCGCASRQLEVRHDREGLAGDLGERDADAAGHSTTL
jgi:hypothetical protein